MSSQFSYHDGRNTAPHRLAARDHGMVFAYGQGPILPCVRCGGRR